jgi:hypothetical protein
MQKPRIKPLRHRGAAVNCPNESCRPRYDIGSITTILASAEFRNYARNAERKWDEEKAQRSRYTRY